MSKTKPVKPKSAICPKCKKRTAITRSYEQPGVYFFNRHFVSGFLFGSQLCEGTGLVYKR